MKQKQRHMKLLALTVVLLLTLTQLFTLSFADNEDVFETALADNEEGADNKPILSVDYLGISSEYEGPKPKQTVPIMESANVTFWVGVSVDKLNQVDFIKNHGLYSLEIGFDYNPTYVEPWGDLEEYSSLRVSSPELTKTEAWMKTLEKFNFGETATTMDENVWNSDLYELVQNDSVRAAGVDTDPWREEVVPENWKMGFVSIRKKDAAEKSEATNRFYGAADTGGKYILKMPFRLKSIPQDGSKPLVFKLSRGPSTLSMGAGANGYEDFAAWEREDRSEPEHNLKNIFTFGGDLNIFGGSSETGAMSDLTVSRTVDGAEEELDLHTDATLDTVVTYTPERLEYYVQVPAKTGEVTITMLGLSEAPTVTYSDNDATTNTLPVSAGSGGYTADVTLVDVDMSKNDGFNNTVTIQVGETSYLVHIRQLVEARIELAYGNSPYGEIMKSDLEDKDEAKAQFNANNRFVEGYVPASATAIAEKGYAYSTRAWVTTESSTSFTEDELARVEDPTINMDRDDKAIFIYNEKAFIDPGFTATNSLGERVELLDRKITVSRVSEDNYVGLNDETQEADEIVIAGKGVDYVISEITPKYVAGGTRIVRPDKYEMVYSFKDPVLVDDPSTADIDESVVTVKRNVVILSPMGDTDLSGAVNGNDSNFIDAYVATLGNIASLKQVKESAYRIFLFRTADTDTTNTINGNDSNAIDSAVATLRQPLQLYVELPSEAIAPEPTE